MKETILAENQWRYQKKIRPNTSTVLATTILKETVNNFLEEDSLVYACF